MLQTVALASVATISLDPTQEAIAWTSRGVAWWVAGFMTFGSAILIYVATRRVRDPAAPTLPAAHQTAAVPTANAVPSIVQITDETLKRWAQSPEVRKLHAA